MLWGEWTEPWSQAVSAADEARDPVIGQKGMPPATLLTLRHADQRLDIFGIERQGTLEKAAPLAPCAPGSSPLLNQALP